MRKKWLLKTYKRVLSFVLTLALIITTFQGISITGYAQEDTTPAALAIDTDSNTESSETKTEDVTETTETSEDVLTEVSGNNIAKETVSVSDNESVSMSVPMELSYIGTTWEDEEGSWLQIDYWGMEENNIEFSENAVLNILSERKSKNENEVFDHILILYPNAPTEIDRQLWNYVAQESLNPDSENSPRQVVYVFTANDTGAEGNSIEWSFWNPMYEEGVLEPVSVGYDMVISPTEKEGVTFKFTEATHPADMFEVCVVASSQKGDYDALITALGEGTDVEITGTDGNWPNAMDVSWDRLNTDLVQLVIRVLEYGEHNDEYMIKPTYIGTTWEDEEGGWLQIDYWGMEENNIEFSENAVLNILSERKSKNENEVFDHILILYPNAPTEIDRQLWNYVAQESLNPDSENSPRQVVYVFTANDTGAEGNSIEWSFWNPMYEEGVLEPVSVGYDMVISPTEKEGVTFKFTEATHPADMFEVCVVASSQKGDYDALITALGEGTDVEITGTDGNWPNAMDVSWDRLNTDLVQLVIRVLEYGEYNDEYTIKPIIYRGDIWEDESTKGLFVSSMNLGKDKFSGPDLKEILQYYIDKGEFFDFIEIEEKYSSANVIKKDYINLARQILKQSEESEKRLSFVFCRCEMSEDTHLQNDMKWSMINPSEAAKDINANVVLTSTVDKGVTIKTTANTYNTERMFLEYIVSSQTELAQKLQSSLGKPADSLDNSLMVVLKNSAEIERNCWAGFSSEFFGDSNYIYFLHINQIDKFTGGVNYLITPYTQAEKKFAVGTEYSLTTLKPVDNGTKLVWKSYNADIAVISATGVLSVLNEGEIFYSVTYKSGGKNCFEVVRAETERSIQKIAFDKSQLVMELPEPDADYESRAFLRTKFYPANAGIDPAELEWTTSDASVVELIPREGESDVHEGEIKAVGEGEAIITAKLQGSDAVVATCRVKVVSQIAVDEAALDNIYAVTNFDVKLSDVKLPEGWIWEAPDTNLTSFKDMNGHLFAAVYQSEDGRERKRLVWVRMVTISDISIVAIEKQDSGDFNIIALPIALADGETVVLNYEVHIKNGGMEDIQEDFDERLQGIWTSNPAGIGETPVEGDYWPESYCFTADTSDKNKGKGKKSFTLSLKDTVTNKTIASDIYALTVVEKPLTILDESSITQEEETTADGKITGKFHIKVPKENYYKLTVKSTDTKVLALGRLSVVEITEGDVPYMDTIVPYTVKKAGGSYLNITAADEVKTSFRKYCEWVDWEPKLLSTKVTVNKATTEKQAEVMISFAEEYDNTDNVQLVGEYADKFELFYEEGSRLVTYTIALKEDNLKKGTYKVGIRIPDSQNGETKECQLLLSVVITDSVPKVTFKQDKNINLFYRYGEDDIAAVIQLEAGNAKVESAELGEYIDKNPAKNKACDYTIVKIDDTLYGVKLNKGVDGKQNKGTITYTLEGYEGSFTQTFKVLTQNKAPKLVLSVKSDTLYPRMGYSNTAFYVTDQATGESVSMDSISWVANKKRGDIREITESDLEAELKNTYRIHKEKDAETGIDWLHFSLSTENKATDKVELQIQEENWTKPVTISYSVTTSVTVPKLKIGNAKLKLNKGNSVFEYQQTSTTLRLSGCSTMLRNEETGVRFTGVDAKANAVLNKSLVLEYWGDKGIIVARLNDNNLEKDNYQYNVWVDCEGYSATIKLTVQVVDELPDKSIKVTKKGSLDVMQRDSTFIAYTPKVANLTGKPAGGYLTGQDADMFESWWDDETGSLRIRLHDNEVYSTKNTYQIKPVYILENEYYGAYDVVASAQSVKIKQGKPKLKVSEYSNVLYRQNDTPIEMSISAVLGKDDIQIHNITLLNYTDDFELVEIKEIDGEKIYYDSVNQNCCIKFKGTENPNCEIVKSGTVTLKFAVQYEQQAGNEKNVQITRRIVIN